MNLMDLDFGVSKLPLPTQAVMLFLFLHWLTHLPAAARTYDPHAEHVRGALDVLRRAWQRILMAREYAARQTPREQETHR